MRKWKTLLVGLGKVGAGYADDPFMARHYPYATHAQVLAAHPAFAWEAVVDPCEAAQDEARNRWSIACVTASVEALASQHQPEVAVIATPPDYRLPVVERLPTLRAVLVEKPLGQTRSKAEAFLRYCDRRGILVQVNLWRRADAGFRALAAGRLAELIGRPQAVFGLYGNGVLNNGLHMIDLVEMLFGRIDSVQAVAGAEPYQAGPIPGDLGVPFTLRVAGGLTVMMQPIRFEHYRENSLDIWGERARLSIMQEGLSISMCPRRPNRAMQGEQEIASDEPRAIESTVGRAFYELYGNLADALATGAPLWSPGGCALQATRVVEAVVESANRSGVPITLC